MTEPPLLEHQREGVAWLRERPHSLLADEPGLGKSRQELEAAVEPVLITAPAMILESGTWDDEIERWAPGIDATQVSYSSIAQRGPKGRVPRDGNGKPILGLKPEYDREWGTVIADESHYLIGRKTNWTVALEGIRTERFRQATGTPIQNWAPEAFSILRFCYPEERGNGKRFGSYWRWAKEWFDVAPGMWSGGALEVGDLRADRTWDEFYAENWGDRMLLRERGKCLDLPPLTVQEWRVRMKGPQAKAYRQLRQDFVTWLDSGVEVAAWNQAAQSVKLLKCATGLEILDPSAKGSAKLDALRTILTDRPRPTLVVGFFRDTVRACAAVAEEVGMEARMVMGGMPKKERRDAARSFKSGNLPVLCATIDTVREGMNFQAADQVVRVEKSFLPSRNEQVIRRLHRMGQDRPVLVIDLLTEGTADFRKERLLEAKTDQQMKALGKADIMGLVN